MGTDIVDTCCEIGIRNTLSNVREGSKGLLKSETVSLPIQTKYSLTVHHSPMPASPASQTFHASSFRRDGDP